MHPSFHLPPAVLQHALRRQLLKLLSLVPCGLLSLRAAVQPSA
jgi:hypothetical protein